MPYTLEANDVSLLFFLVSIVIAIVLSSIHCFISNPLFYLPSIVLSPIAEQTALFTETTIATTETIRHSGAKQSHLKIPQQTMEEYTADDILSKIEVSQRGEAAASRQIDIRNVIASGELTEEKRVEIMKSIVEKHMMESAKLESDLRQAELKQISQILEDIEQKKEKAAAEIKEELKQKLKEAESDEERENLILEYAKKLQDTSNALQDEKVKRLKDKRNRLLKERMNKKKDLMR